ncbi:MocR-like pyridoxine biosynthesis transcription factor PdxR [Deinococcus kurensis]|uniref:MocR-like pyridoxine biosynthesis transcription factor PdxR n=1 Tax=Deinococcus kurensis TaxID=2662757 RepID=UPI0012D2A7B8|nr:PLP-dependent aminotransferase family protein [Deinococcus kurensis]
MAGAGVPLTPDAPGPGWLDALTLPPAQPGETRHAQVTRALRGAITRGLLPEGTRLPGHRRLADHLGVARNTLVDALAQLELEGYVQAQGRSGTRVSVPANAPPAPSAAALPLSAWAQRALAGQVEDAGGEYVVDFRVGQPVPELYPEAAWTQALARRAAQALRTGTPDDPLGPLETRRALAAHLNAERGAQVTPNMLLLTGGTQGALDALARVFLEPGRVAAVEDPTYPGARAALAATGAQVQPVAVDDQGVQPTHLPAQATLLYVTPGCQYPTGTALPATRRQALITWARHSGAFILEDDYAADLYHAARPPAVMQGVAPDRVILLGSFSKSLAPVTRSGFLVAPPDVVRVLAATRPLTDRVPGRLDALALADVLGSGAYSRHLRRVRSILTHRRDVLLQELTAHLPGWTPHAPPGGLHLYLPLPTGWTEARALERAATQGVALSPVAPLAQERRPPAVLLGFAHLPTEHLRIGAARLAQAWAAPA